MKNIIIAFRSLFKEGRHNIMKIVSLGIGLAVGLILIAKVYFEQSYDNFYPEADRVYRIYEKYMIDGDLEESLRIPGGVAPLLKETTPEVESVTRFTYLREGATFTMSDNKHRLRGTFILADSCLFDVLPRPMLQGNAKEVLSQPMYVLISDEIAERIGGDVIGKRFEIDDAPGAALIIGGVFERLPENVSEKFDIIASLSSISKFMWDGSNGLYGNDRYSAFLKVHPGTTPAQLTAGMEQMCQKFLPLDEFKKAGVELSFTFHEFLKIHSEDSNVKRMSLMLMLIAFALIFTAVMNYILIVVSSLINRTKEVAVHKCYGASERNIHSMIFAEALVHTVLALGLVFLLLLAGRGVIEKLIGTSLVALFFSKGMIVLLAICIVVLLVTGLLPGVLFSRIPVAAVFRRFSETRRLWKLALLFFQFVAACFLVSLLFVVGRQYNRMVNDDTGYTYEKLAYVPVSAMDTTTRVRMVNELRTLKEVKSVSSASQLAFYGCSGNNISFPGDSRELFNVADLYDVGDGYLGLMEIPIVEGAFFTEGARSPEVMVSRSFVEKMKLFADWSDGAVGKSISITAHDFDENGNAITHTICGVFEDYRQGTISSEDPRAKVMFYNRYPSDVLLIKYNELTAEALHKTQGLLERLAPDKEVSVKVYRNEMTNLYSDSQNFRDSVLAGGGITLLIVFIGLIGYTTDEANRRRKELAIRKINGATWQNILTIFLRDIIWIALPAALLGGGFAYAVAQRWQEQFSEKVPLSWYLFAGGAMLVLAVILSVAGYNVHRITNDNPVDSIKSE